MKNKLTNSTDKFIILLDKCDYDEIKDYLLEKELEFYNNDLKDLVLYSGFSVPNYNKLMDILEINDLEPPTFSDIFTDEIMVNSINIYKTNVYNLYFIRKEQFGLRDEDAAINELIFTDNLENLIEKAKQELLNRYLVKDLHLGK
ncbi:hypothetical protein [Peptacetobacter hiranonis]|uniref:Uncharacterized protein n=1 Tax=Peptacetobacter hiranonis (strain DSM 13275 / JCM 10541 / KCTC 15199 / TO-931) TaxID=500633 RepID=B6FXY8_PEPHT|nr:hypothetical protein [Peptacetobacter hiranonis]EEA85633.1 hypothetical protein CLOHIR_00739 [Peptacetobacter hiranonis DSM 13275]QEK20038.1 hypothetical protein KGNDJEFE_00519 [Peptacetobacter hiranonis]